jgi:very-short-patch-repair endonuclease
MGSLEKELRLFLEKNNIEHEKQVRFDWLRTTDTFKKMSLDYYIPSKKIAIECQGIQHFNTDYYWPSAKDKIKILERIQERDKLKKKLCEEHGIKVLYFSDLGITYPYEVFENKEKLLEEINKK